jgi:hypothetical protein
MTPGIVPHNDVSSWDNMTGKTDGSMKAVASTRWEELKETVQYHAKMSALMDSPTIFKVRLHSVPMRFIAIARLCKSHSQNTKMPSY